MPIAFFCSVLSTETNCCKSPDAPLASVELQNRGEHAQTSFALSSLGGAHKANAVSRDPPHCLHQLHSVSTLLLSAYVMIHCGFSWQPYFHVFVFENVLKLPRHHREIQEGISATFLCMTTIQAYSYPSNRRLCDSFDYHQQRFIVTMRPLEWSQCPLDLTMDITSIQRSKNAVKPSRPGHS